MDVQLRISFHHPVRQLLDIGIGKHACRHGQLAAYRIAGESVLFLPLAHGILKFIYEKSDHSDTVFQLQIAVIALLLRHFPPGEDVPFIACMNEMDAVLLKAFPLIPFDRIDYLRRLFFIKRL